MSNAANLRSALRATRFRLGTAEANLDEIERVCEAHGYGGEQAIAEWLAEQLKAADPAK